jgi:hypothetical protein
LNEEQMRIDCTNISKASEHNKARRFGVSVIPRHTRAQTHQENMLCFSRSIQTVYETLRCTGSFAMAIMLSLDIRSETGDMLTA